MPIFRIGDKLHYFAHVPKCGGTSIESYLTQRFGRLALHEPGRTRQDNYRTWNRTNSNHIPLATLGRLLPIAWLDSSFAVVRHPVRRFISAFFFARDLGKEIPLTAEINQWLQSSVKKIEADPYHLDGHFAPQHSFIPAGSRIFRFEEGLEQVIPYLDQLAGSEDGPRTLPAHNIGRWRGEEAEPALEAATLTLLARLYAEDFKRFGYDIAGPSDVTALPDLAPLAATGQPPQPAKRLLINRIYRKLLIKANIE